MKKPIVTLFFLMVFAISSWAETVTLDDALKMLDTNFNKYPYAQFLQRDKTDDNRNPRVDVVRIPYEGGEYFKVSIIKGGYRYDVRIDFIEKEEPYSRLIRDIKLQTYALLADILPKDS